MPPFALIRTSTNRSSSCGLLNHDERFFKNELIINLNSEDNLIKPYKLEKNLYMLKIFKAVYSTN